MIFYTDGVREFKSEKHKVFMSKHSYSLSIFYCSELEILLLVVQLINI